MIRENTMLTDDYHFWYIGKSYFDAYHCQKFPLGESQQKEFARRSIYYFYEYICHTHNYAETQVPQGLDEFAYYAMYCIGIAHKFLGQLESAIECFNRAGKFCPRRNEHIVKLAEICSEQKDYLTLLAIANYLCTEERKNPFPDLMFLIDNNSYYDTGNYIEHLKNIALTNMPKL
jgi:tetratricopeptide (TPR) repeat protein